MTKANKKKPKTEKKNPKNTQQCYLKGCLRFHNPGHACSASQGKGSVALVIWKAEDMCQPAANIIQAQKAEPRPRPKAAPEFQPENTFKQWGGTEV